MPQIPRRTTSSTVSWSWWPSLEEARMLRPHRNRAEAISAAAGVYASVDHLVSLEGRARDLSFMQKAPVQRQLAGRMQSRLRGRGLIFEELREYLPGDDIRTIDWRVTARTEKPVVRVYAEEKERPALIV